METYELSKLKPASVAIAMVGEIRAKGKTVEDRIKNMN